MFIQIVLRNIITRNNSLFKSDNKTSQHERDIPLHFSI